MKEFIQKFGVFFLVIIILCLICKVSPTLEQQIPFNQKIWKYHPVRKIRYYMSDSVMKWLNTEHPTYDMVLNKLGTEKEPFDPQGDRTHLSYLLKIGMFSLGMDWYVLEINFNEDGTVKESYINLMD